MFGLKHKRFCDINPTCYKISMEKEIFKRNISDLFSGVKLAKDISERILPVKVFEFNSNMIKRAPGVDLTTQLNKAVNIDIACKCINGVVVHPGEVFSFWKLIGRITPKKGYLEGRTIVQNRLVTGIGGGLCNLGNSVNRLVLHTPMEIVEFHKHSDALAPDEGERVPLSAGTAVAYNYIDYRFRNNSDQDVQLLLWCEGETLFGEFRAEREFPCRYELAEEGHCFQEEKGKYYRVSKIYRKVIEKESGKEVGKELIWDNHSEVMFDYSLIPPEQIKEIQYT